MYFIPVFHETYLQRQVEIQCHLVEKHNPKKLFCHEVEGNKAKSSPGHSSQGPKIFKIM